MYLEQAESILRVGGAWHRLNKVPARAGLKGVVSVQIKTKSEARDCQTQPW